MPAFLDHASTTQRDVSLDPTVAAFSPPVPIVAGWIALVSAVAVVIGSFGPWVEVIGIFNTFTVKGSIGDGKITAALGITAALLIFVRCKGNASEWTMGIATFCLLVAGAIGIYQWNNLSGLVTDAQEEEFAGLMTIGWGLQAIAVGGVGGTIAAISHLFRNEIQQF